MQNMKSALHKEKNYMRLDDIFEHVLEYPQM